ncbi:MAG: HAD family hydrolase [Dehalococcoidia bacterium]
MQAIIFDLDDTLIPESSSLRRALLRTAGEARRRFGVDPAAFSKAVLQHAGQLWAEAPTAEYCERLGIAAWEGLTSGFTHFGDHDGDADRRYLREWAPSYRQQAWKRALDDFNAGDWMAACVLAERFRTDRFEMHVPHDGAHEVLDGLEQRGYTLAVLTNGPADLQAQKLVKTGLKRHFDNERTFISGALGLGKPDLELFRHVLERLSIEPREAVMVGDSVYRDIDPALASGMNAIWIRNGRSDDLLEASVPRVDTLEALLDAIETMEERQRG